MSPLTSLAIEIAARQVGVRELGRNRGEKVEMYQASVGAKPGDAWCACFVYWCFEHAARELGITNPLPRTRGALKIWKGAAPFRRRIHPAAGLVFVVDHGGGLGHVGLVEHDQGDDLVTIEGNTHDGGGRDGDGVYRRIRHLSTVNVGYLDFGAVKPASGEFPAVT